MNIPRGNGERGTWRPLQIGPQHTSSLYCPGCGHCIELERHTIDAQGDVSGLVRCPNSLCHFEDFVRLDGWTSLLLSPSHPLERGT